MSNIDHLLEPKYTFNFGVFIIESLNKMDFVDIGSNL